MSRLFPQLIAATLTLLAVAMFGAAALGLDYWLGVVGAAAVKGNVAAYLNPTTWAPMAAKARLCAGVLLGLALLVLWRRRELEGWASAIAADAPRAGRSARAWLRATLAEDGRAGWLALAAITLAGAAIRLYHLNQPMRTDEALVYLVYVKKPLYLIVTLYNNVGNHVFQTILSHWCWQLLGNAEWAVRLPVFLSGCLLPPLLFVAVRLSHGREVALIAAALAAGSTLLIEYSVNARGYEVLGLLIVALMLPRAILARSDNGLVWLLWAVGAALAFWTNPAAVLSFGVLAAWLLLDLLQRPAATRRRGVILFVTMTGLGGLLTVLLYAPILVTFGIGHMGTMVQSGVTALTFGSPLARLMELWTGYTGSLPAPLTWLLALALPVGAVLEALRRRGSLPLALLLWLGLYLAVFPVFGYLRLWLPLAVYVFLPIAVGLVWLLGRLGAGRARPAGLALALLLTVLGVGREFVLDRVHQNTEGTFFESAEIARLLAARLGPGDRIYAPCPAGMPLLYVFERQGVPASLITLDRHDTEGQPVQLIALGDRPPGPGDHLYVVLTETVPPLKESLEQLLPDGAAAKTAPELVQSYPTSRLYRLPMPPVLGRP